MLFSTRYFRFCSLVAIYSINFKFALAKKAGFLFFLLRIFSHWQKVPIWKHFFGHLKKLGSFFHCRHVYLLFRVLAKYLKLFLIYLLFNVTKMTKFLLLFP